MIGRLRGVLLEAGEEVLLVEAGGVAYEVEVGAPTRAALPAAGAEVTLYTHLVVREDAQLLYGFATRAARELFRTLIRTSGVGPKLAMAILSTFDTAELAAVVHAHDIATLARVPGIGKRTAERLLVELKDRLGEIVAPAPAAVATAGPAGLDAERALVALGYRPAEATRMISAVLAEHADLDTEQLVREALKAAST